MLIDDLDVAIICSFSSGDPRYSLVTGAASICKMMEMAGIKYTLYVNENFKDPGSLDGFNIAAEIPNGPTYRDKINDELAERIAIWLVNLKQNTYITFDLMVLSWFVTHNSGIRDVIPLKKDARWLHFQRSGPGARQEEFPGYLRTTLAPNSKYVYLNEADAIKLAETLGGDLADIKICHNPADALHFWGISKQVSDLLNEKNILDSDIIQLLPFSTPRWEAKGVDKVMMIFGELKKLGYRVSLILANAHSNNNKNHIESIKGKAEKHGIKDDVIIVSEHGFDGLDRQDIKGLFCLSDLFVFPTISEACSNVVLEASLGGNLLVLNSDFPPMLEFAHPSTMAFEFGSTRRKRDRNSEWYANIARNILVRLKSDLSLQQKRYVRKRHSYKWVIREQLLPMLLEDHLQE